ncbi:MAG: HAMP domain-containing histidine kinase [Anaerolineales bacterium]|nr:HAMP domain-containing histidine kinase [Anaerolineales bacterium]MCB0017973.1 HAMP domain-containing histidine kinase [Anaerolineales bacterium]
MFRSLRARLFAAYLGLVVIGFGGLTLWAGNLVATSTLDDVGSSLQVVAFSLANQLSESVEEGRGDRSGLAATIAANIGGEAAIFDRQNELLDRSAGASSQFLGTDSYGLRDNAAGVEMFYTQANIVYEGRAIGTLQLELPTATARHTIRERWLGLGAAFLAFSILAIMFSSWLLTSLTRPLARLQAAALAMAGGDLSQRVAPGPRDEIGSVASAFNQMAARVEATIAEQKAFASNAAHELRTPLTTIRLRSEALQTDLDEAVSARYIREIDSEAARMGKLVEDLMLLSRADTGRLPISHEPIDAVRVWQRLEREYGPRLRQQELTLTANLPGTPIQVGANPTHLHIVFRNVLDNALKYTPAGGQIAVSLQAVGGQLQLQVRDTGRGIAPDDLPQIGKRFFRADKARGRDIPGTGLGLALVTSVLEQYGGELKVDSPGVGQGTVVTVRWPC